MATARQQAQLFAARERRHERFLKAGAGYSSPSLRVSPGTLITPPVSAQEELEPVTLAWSFEFFNPGTYPAGTLLDTGVFTVDLTALGVLSTTGPIVLSVDLSDPTIPGAGVPPNGTRAFVLFLDPTNNRAGLFVEGDQVAQGTGIFIDWSGAAWDYMNAVTDADSIGDLEVFPNFTPPTFVG